MKLELKREYLEWSIGSGGRSIKRKLKNVDPSEFEKLYNEGYKEFFIVKEEKSKVVKNINIEIKEDNLNDINK